LSCNLPQPNPGGQQGTPLTPTSGPPDQQSTPLTSTMGPVGTWTPCSSGLYGGIINSLAASPDYLNDHTVLAATDGKGIFCLQVK